MISLKHKNNLCDLKHLQRELDQVQNELKSLLQCIQGQYMIQCILSLVPGRMQEQDSSGAIAFALVYLTFFLDNVLLTVLVPIIPDWVRGESLELWSQHDAPLAKLLNSTVRHVTQDNGQGVGSSQLLVGAVLGAKAASQLLSSPGAASLVSCRGAATCLRLATALLAIAALTFGVCAGGGVTGGVSGVAGGGAACAGAGRAVQGAGAALGGVSGLALVARALPHAQHRALAALLGAVALGVLVGYPFGGAAYKLWSSAAPFQLMAFALLINLALQYIYLNKEAYNMVALSSPSPTGGARALLREARCGAAGACAGAVLLTTSVMAALEPCLPLWIMTKFHPQRWALGAVFVPDSAGYLAASALGNVWQRAGAERVAVTAVACVGVASMLLPLAPSVGWLSLPQCVVGAGLGAADAALVPALLARAPPAALPARAALLQAASSAAYAVGPVVGGLVSWAAGFERALCVLGAANALYAVLLYRVLARHPLSPQWGASESPEESEAEGEELTPLKTTALDRPINQLP